MFRKLSTSAALSLGRIRVSAVASDALRPMSTQQEQPQASPNQPHYRTKESDPERHSVADVGKFYTVPPAFYNKLLLHKGLHPHYQQLIHLFGECCLLVRQPALTIRDYLVKSDYTKPPNTYLLYGRLGMGKTFTLAHTLHYCYSKQWLILHLPDTFAQVRLAVEVIPSTANPELMDTPKECGHWLKMFLNINGPLLESLQLQTSQRYVWSQREVTEEGVPITELADMGIKRPIYSSECVRAILREIAHHSASRRFKTLVAIDGVNNFYTTTCQGKMKTQVECSKLVFVDAFLELIRNRKLQNGAFVFALDSYHFRPQLRPKEYSPMHLLTEKGIEDLDPFLPVLVDKLTETEFSHYLDYFSDKKWIQHPAATTEAGREELKFLSGMCAGELDDILTSL